MNIKSYLNSNISKINFIGYTLFTIFVFATCFYIIFPTLGINGTSSTSNILAQAVFIVITAVSIVSFNKNYTFLHHIIKNKIVIVLIFDIYIAFALSASHIFFENNFSISAIVKFFCIIIWCIPVTFLILRILDTLFLVNYNAKIDNVTSYYIYGISFAIFCSVSTFMLFSFYPGFSSQDTLNQFNQALGIVPITNWQTPFHTLIIRILLSIINNPAFVVVCQFVFFACVISSGLRYFYLIGVKPVVLFSFLGLFILSPTNLVLINTIWKDIPYAANILWITIILCKIIKPTDVYKPIYTKYLFYIEIFCSIVSVSLLRQNGFVVAIISAVTMLILSTKKFKMSVALILSAIVVLLFNGPFFTYMNITESESAVNGKYIGLAQDIIGVEVYGGNLSEASKYIVETLIDGNEDYVYTPSNAKSSGIENLNISMSEFIKEYSVTFLNNPSLMTKAILQRNWLMWDLTTTPNGHIGTLAYMQTMDDYDADNYLDWLEISPESKSFIPVLSSFLKTIVEVSTKTPFSWVFWRVGIYTLIMFACITILLLRKRMKMIVVFIPVAAQLISLILSTGWADYRYFWPCTFCVIYGMIFISSFNISVKNKKLN